MPPRRSETHIDEKVQKFRAFVCCRAALLASRNGSSLKTFFRQKASVDEKWRYMFPAKNEDVLLPSDRRTALFRYTLSWQNNHRWNHVHQPRRHYQSMLWKPPRCCRSLLRKRRRRCQSPLQRRWRCRQCVLLLKNQRFLRAKKRGWCLRTCWRLDRQGGCFRLGLIWRRYQTNMESISFVMFCSNRESRAQAWTRTHSAANSGKWRRSWAFLCPVGW